MSRFEEMPDTPEFSNHNKSDEVIHFRTKQGDDLMDENGNYRNYAGYQILSEIGHGGGGIVYRARKFNEEHAVDVALKRPHPNSLLNPKFKEILKREAKRMSALHHDHILRVLDWSDDPQEP